MEVTPAILSLLDQEQALLEVTIAYLEKRQEQRRQEDRREDERRQKAKPKEREVWVRSWILRRPLFGQYEHLMAELAQEDRPGFTNFQRVDPELFQELVERVGPRIQRADTNYRKALSPGLRLAITLRYLATGDSYKSLAYGFRVPNNSISKIVPDTCEAIIQEYQQEYFQCPSTPEEWKRVSDGFANRWNFHNTVGALDGKHVAIKCPPKAGSVYYNYNGFHSIVLMALVDAEAKFLYVDVGSNGGLSDAGIFSDCDLRTALEANTLGLPEPASLPNDNEAMPFCIVGDDAFPMRSWLMKPYPHKALSRPQRIFNYRLSRARRIVENAFGILAHRFRCLLGTMQQHPQRVETIVLAACVLHNMLTTRKPQVVNQVMDREDPATHDVIPGQWREHGAMTALEHLRGNQMTKAAKGQRDYLCSYYNSDVGRVHWQDDKI